MMGKRQSKRMKIAPNEPAAVKEPAYQPGSPRYTPGVDLPEHTPEPSPDVQGKLQPLLEPKPKPVTYEGQVIPKKVFVRILREITEEYRSGRKWEKDAVRALHEDSEAFLMEMFQRSNTVAKAFGKSTLRVLVP